MAVKRNVQEREEILNTMALPIIPSDEIRISSEKTAVISCNVGFSLESDKKAFRDDSNLGTASLISDASSSSEESLRLHYYTRSEIRRHNTEASAWIVAGEDIYDVTDYIEHHPGGKYSIMKKIGGAVDCTQDLKFHSKSGQKYWDRFLVGKVTRTISKNRLPVEKDWWRFWE